MDHEPRGPAQLPAGTVPSDEDGTADERWLHRVLSHIPESTTVLCINAPVGSRQQEIAEQWLASRSPSPVPAQVSRRAQPMIRALGARTLSQQPDGYLERIILCETPIEPAAELSRLLDLLSPHPVVLISTIAYNATAALFNREDTTILLPEVVFHSPDELDERTDKEDGAQLWHDTLGWPLAVELVHAATHGSPATRAALERRCASSLENWLRTAPPQIRRLLPLLAHVPRFDQRVMESLAVDSPLPAHADEVTSILGISYPLRLGGVNRSQWYRIPPVMAQIIINLHHRGYPSRIAAERKWALDALAGAGPWRIAVDAAMDCGDLEVALHLLGRYWALAFVEDSVQVAGIFNRLIELHARNAIPLPVESRLFATILEMTRESGVQGCGGSMPRLPRGTLEASRLHARLTAMGSGARESSAQLLIRMIWYRLQDNNDEALRIARILERRLVDGSASSLKHHNQAEHAVLWFHTGMTLLLSMELAAARAAFRRAQRISIIAGFQDYRERCDVLLLLIQCILGQVKEVGIPDQAPPSIQGASPFHGAALKREVRSLCRGFNALWRLDKDELQEVLRDPDCTGGQLEPLAVLLQAARDLLFGERHRAEGPATPLEASGPGAHRGLRTRAQDVRAVLSLIGDGHYAQAIGICDAAGSESSWVMETIRAMVLALRGDFAPLPALVSGIIDDPATPMLLRSVVEVMLVCARADDGQPVSPEDVRDMMSPHRELVVLLPGWFLGCPIGRLTEVFGLTAEEAGRLQQVTRPGSFLGTDKLSERELEILRAVARGHHRRQIAEDHFISVNTVKSHLASCYRKLGVDNREQALERASDWGYLSLVGTE